MGPNALVLALFLPMLATVARVANAASYNEMLRVDTRRPELSISAWLPLTEVCGQPPARFST